MVHYFAYGSNMLGQRLQARVGAVAVVGPARLDEHVHSFCKLGRDGTGKGSITPCPGSAVYGVVYRLTDEQLTTLSSFEGGYRQISLVVHCLGEDGDDGATGILAAESFCAIRPVTPLAPTAEYVAYYERGMSEHDLPAEYRAAILAQAHQLWQAVKSEPGPGPGGTPR
ncbi:MAG: gamma-glutamylcyclotransferase family protein [Myxococcota bacterium]